MCLGGHSNEFPNMFKRSFVFDKSPSQETYAGKILAIDFSGSVLKLGLYSLRNEKSGMIKKTSIVVPKKETAKHMNFFDWIAPNVLKFVDHGDKNESIIAGFAFPYPLEQTSLRSGKILSIVGNFHFIPIELGSDPAICLSDSFKRKGLDIDVCVLVNDAIATLMSVDKGKGDHIISIVIGNGTNAAYFKQEDGCETEAINLGWGSFDSIGIRRNVFDCGLELNFIDDEIESGILDRYASDLGFRPLLNAAACVCDRGCQRHDYKQKEIREIINDGVATSEIYKLIKNIRRRSVLVTVSLVIGLMKTMGICDLDRVVLVLGGTFFEDKYEYNMFIQEASIYFIINEMFYIDFDFEQAIDGSLDGILRIIQKCVLPHE